MAEMEFSDGKHQIDDEFVGLILEATNGSPGSFTRREALRLIGPRIEKRILRDAQSDLIRRHFRQWPGRSPEP